MAEQEKLYLHVVIVKKDGKTLEEAKKIAQGIIKNSSKKFYRETEDSWRFRNIPKTAFKTKSFVTKVVREDLSLVFGHLK